MDIEEFLHRRDVPEDIKDVLVREMQEKKRLKRAVLDAEEKLRCIVDQNVAGIYIVQDGRFKYVNSKFANALGYTPEELMALDSVLDIVVESDRLFVAENLMKRLFGSVKSTQYSLRVMRKDGSVIEAEVHGTQADFNGKPAIIGVAIEKPTERSKA
ncbi:MAG: PAS domain S-box protein [Candidatus Aenigmarchaeota archaeon]|nr:PAS domain S-box protein [Candidatus Aenigmarchaeota archaeon]